ncbi:hypothetical protein HDE_11063 [Halotydeus destructor]|nr:hypothetical protein HDE_11063 [Halotydeus destructor]
MLVIYISLCTRVDSLSNLYDAVNEKLNAYRKKWLAIAGHLMVSASILTSMIAYKMVVINLDDAEKMKSDATWIKILLWIVEHISPKLVEAVYVYTNVSFVFAAILVFALTQISLKLLAGQALENMLLGPKNRISSLSNMQRDFKLAIHHKLSTDRLVTMPEVLPPYFVASIVLPFMDLTYFVVPSERRVFGDNNLNRVDFNFMVLIFLTMPILVNMVTKQYDLLREQALKFVQIDELDENVEIAVAKLPVLIEVSKYRVEPMQLYGFISYDCTLLWKGALIFGKLELGHSVSLFKEAIVKIWTALHI